MDGVLFFVLRRRKRFFPKTQIVQVAVAPSDIPLTGFQIDMAGVLQSNALSSQQFRLLAPAGHQPARVIYNAMARIPPVTVGAAEHRPHLARVPVSPDQPGDLTVGSHAPFRYFLHDREDLVDQPFIRYTSHRHHRPTDIIIVVSLRQAHPEKLPVSGTPLHPNVPPGDWGPACRATAARRSHSPEEMRQTPRWPSEKEKHPQGVPSIKQVLPAETQKEYG